MVGMAKGALPGCRAKRLLKGPLQRMKKQFKESQKQ
jgi:hypothetical protein